MFVVIQYDQRLMMLLNRKCLEFRIVMFRKVHRVKTNNFFGATSFPSKLFKKKVVPVIDEY